MKWLLLIIIILLCGCAKTVKYHEQTEPCDQLEYDCVELP